MPSLRHRRPTRPPAKTPLLYTRSSCSDFSSRKGELLGPVGDVRRSGSRSNISAALAGANREAKQAVLGMCTAHNRNGSTIPGNSEAFHEQDHAAGVDRVRVDSRHVDGSK